MVPKSKNKRSADWAAVRPAKRSKPVKKVTSSTDTLQWKPVEMPDVLDDVEGFYGLEEVEGVDIVVKDDGKVEYQILDEAAVKPKKSKSKKAHKKVDEEKEVTMEDHEDEEWHGISDSEEQPTEAQEQIDEKDTAAEDDTTDAPDADKPKKELSEKQLKAREKRREKQKERRKVNKAKGNGETQEKEAAPENPFELLENAEEDDIELPAWESLGLSLPTLRAIAKMRFNEPTKIQAAAIPEILAGHDLIGKASTGSGKTLAFGIPILESYLASSADYLDADGQRKDRDPMALIFAPTRELAHQLRDHLTALSEFAPDFRIVTLTGGLSLQKQLRQLEEKGGADLIIATPGRLWEVVSEGKGWIDRFRTGLKFLVVDEADRLLQEGHFQEVKDLLELMRRAGEDEVEDDLGYGGPTPEDVQAVELARKPKKAKAKPVKRQTLIFSATFHKGLQQKLDAKGKKAWNNATGGDLMDTEESMQYLLKKLDFREERPKFIDVNPVSQMAAKLREGMIECGAMEKDLYLYYLLLRYPCRTLVFTNSISSVKRLTPMLNELGLSVHPLHSNMIQKARMRNLERFSSDKGNNSVLISTDVAARGLDIKGIDMVVHYHLPRTADMYVHRSGRTARADARGISVLLCSPEEVSGVRRLVGKIHEGDGNKSNARYNMKSFSVDRSLAGKLKKRVDLAKKIADSHVEKQKKHKEEDWLKQAAEDLGVEYDSEDFNTRRISQKGERGKLKREKAASATRADIANWKAELKALLRQKINSGISERYLTNGLINVAQAMIDGEGFHEQILGLEKKNVVDDI